MSDVQEVRCPGCNSSEIERDFGTMEGDGGGIGFVAGTGAGLLGAAVTMALISVPFIVIPAMTAAAVGGVLGGIKGGQAVGAALDGRSTKYSCKKCGHQF